MATMMTATDSLPVLQLRAAQHAQLVRDHLERRRHAVGLTIDGVAYRVKPSPGLRIPLGDGATMQAIFSDTPPARRDDDPPTAPERP